MFAGSCAVILDIPKYLFERNIGGGVTDETGEGEQTNALIVGLLAQQAQSRNDNTAHFVFIERALNPVGK
jgi:hypothetical protein